MEEEGLKDGDMLSADSEEDVQKEEEEILEVEEGRANLRQIAPLCFLQLCETWNSDSLFSYVGWLVYDFSYGDLTKDQVGNWAGFIASCYFLGSVLSSYAWGWASDRLGKKNLLIAGGCGTLISVLLFGFSRSILWAVLSRALCGKGKRKVCSVVFIVFGAGVLNGNLGIAKAFVGSISNSKNQAVHFSILGACWGMGSILGSFFGGLLARPAKKWDIFKETVFDTFPYLLTNLVAAFVVLIGIINVVVFLKEPEEAKKETKDNLSRRWSIWQLRIFLPVITYAFTGMSYTFFKETFPLFLLSSPRVGGLDFTTTKTGIIIGVAGVAYTVFALFVYKHLANRLGVVLCFRIGVTLFTFVVLLFPPIGYLYGNDVALWAALCPTYIACVCIGQITFASLFTLISNSTHREGLGRVNGLAQTLVALARACSPIIAGRLFAWSVSDPNRVWPVNIWFNFFICCIVFCLMLGVSFFFSNDLNYPKKEDDIIELEEIEAEIIDETDEEENLI